MYLRQILLFILLKFSTPVYSSFYSKEDKVCDPLSKGLVTYSGFRIHREYIINSLNPPVLHFNSISHCEHGTVDFERLVKVDRNTDISFNKPFCMLKPNYIASKESEKQKSTSVENTIKRSVTNDVDLIQGQGTIKEIKRRNQHDDQNLKDVIDGIRSGRLKIDKGRRGGVMRHRNVKINPRGVGVGTGVEDEDEDEIEVYDYSEIQDIYEVLKNLEDEDEYEDDNEEEQEPENLTKTNLNLGDEYHNETYYNYSNYDFLMENNSEANLDREMENNALKAVSSYSLMSYIMDFAQGIISKLVTRTKFEEYIGRKKSVRSKKFEILTPGNIKSAKIDDLVCYNMVRRKKYAKRKLSIFAPFRFVGGLYECGLPLETKKKIFDGYSKSLSTPELKCDPSMSKPVAPLISDQISGQWFQISSGINIMQRIPYLYSPQAYDLRFSGLFEAKSNRESWYSELDVNEDYEYKDIELSLISKAVTETSNRLCKIVLDIERMFKKDHQLDVDEKSSYLLKLLRNLEFRSLSSLGLLNREEAAAKLEVVEKAWDELNI